MHRPDIKAGLLLAGHNQSTVAETLGVTQSAVSRVISGELHSPHIAEHIAALLRRTTASLWPAVYGPRASRRRAA